MRRPRGSGSVYFRRQDGRWCVALSLGGRRRLVRYAADRRAAHDLLATLSTRPEGPIGPARITLAGFSARWLETIGPTLRPSTVLAYRRWLDRYILPEFGHLRIDHVTPMAIAAHYARLSRRGLSARTIACAHQVLHKLLTDAVRWRITNANAAAGLDRPRVVRKEATIWTATQARAFARYIEGRADHHAALWALGLYGGLRPGEALGVVWDDLLGDTVHVRRTATRIAGERQVGPPKTAAGRRTVSLPSAAVRLLSAWRRRQAELRLRSGQPWPDPLPMVCAGPRPPAANESRRALARACRALALPIITLHGLRHVHATLAVAGGADLRTLAARLGHTRPSFTLSVYSHVLPGQDAALAAALGDSLEAGA